MTHPTEDVWCVFRAYNSTFQQENVLSLIAKPKMVLHVLNVLKTSELILRENVFSPIQTAKVSD